MSLEILLDKYDNKTITVKELNSLKQKFNSNLINFLLCNCYNIKVLTTSTYREKQIEWKENLLKRFDNKCIITSNNCLPELNACHIKPFHVNNDFNINNGLILTQHLHKTFDLFYWTIHPETHNIIINDEIKNIGTISKYKNIKLQFNFNTTTFNKYLIYHYNKFIKKLKNVNIILKLTK